MDLKQGSITVKEVLKHPDAKALLYEELPDLMRSPLVKMAGGMTLNQVLTFNKGVVPQKKVDALLKKLETL